jgi:AcrR family transcriptional regulator
MSPRIDAYHHGNLRNMLLEIGERLLEDLGVSGLTLRGLAREAGVSHAAPYRHFSSRTELLAALATRGFLRLEQELVAAMDCFPDDPLRQLQESGERYVRLGLLRPAMYGLLFGAVLPKTDRPAALAEAGSGAFMALVAIIERGQAAGVFRREPTLDLAFANWSLVHGITELAIAGHLPPPDAAPEAAVFLARRLCSLLTYGLLTPEASSPPSPVQRPCGNIPDPIPG